MRSANKNVLTKTELKIILLVCRQFTNREVGARLGLSKRTIDGHREKINRKTKSKNSAGVVLYAIRNGLYTVKVNKKF